MDENHEIEQYFFHEPALQRLADLAEGYDSVCCLCTPALGQELFNRGRVARVLDIDERFAHLPGYRRYDLYQPEDFGEKYDLIVCDIPLLTFPVSQFLDIVTKFSRGDFSQRILTTFVSERAPEVLEAFAPFGLEATGYFPPYRTDHNQTFVQFFSNLGPEMNARLRGEAAE